MRRLDLEIPRILLSDGTAFHTGMAVCGTDEAGVLTGSPVSHSVVDAAVHVVFDSRVAQIETGSSETTRLRDLSSRAILARSEDHMTTGVVRKQVVKYLARARQALAAGELALAHDDYITTINRAYYATFYAANAILSTQGLERSKHSGVIAAFRQQFVKTGLIEAEYSDIYGAVMEDRAEADYNLEFDTDADQAGRDMGRARRFVSRVEHALNEMGMLP